MTRPPEILKTSRLTLRPPALSDADGIFQGYAQDLDVTRYLIWRPHSNVAVTREFLSRCLRCWQDGTAFPWVAVRSKDDALLGMIELRIDRFKADFGYAIARNYWGQGYATEMARSVVVWALAQPEIYRVWATCDTQNLASARVLEKAGLQREGILRRYMLHPNISDEPRDSYCYSIVK